MKKLSLLLSLVLLACGAAASSAREEAGPDRSAGVQPASTVGETFYREGLAGVDFSGLDAVAKERALRILNAEHCDCGCSMTIAQCRVEDKTCPRSPSLAAAIVNAIRTGASDEQTLAALKALRNASGAAGAAPPDAQPVPVKQIAVEKSPYLGRADAPITIVTFEDFQ